MTRRHDLDWLRVLLFALLVPHHVAVGFVEWGTDIYRFVNDRLAGDGMTLFIYWSHSWRLPSLFLIAGIGTWFPNFFGCRPWCKRFSPRVTGDRSRSSFRPLCAALP